jgi:tripartite-type tricarboxylate transporter receptor subunit TctC
VTDVSARLFADLLSRRTGVPVVVENRGGAGGIVGTEAAARAPADGHTVLLATSGELAINPAIYPSLPYDPKRDLRGLAMLTETPLMLVASAASGHRRLRDLIDAAKARPGEVPYASPGNGTMSHLTSEWFAMAAGVRLQHIPYRGGGPASAAIASGEVPFGVVGVSAGAPFVQSGQMSALAVTTERRSSLLPDLPTVVESGVPDFDASIWVGLYVPTAVPEAPAAWLQEQSLAVARSPEFASRLAAQGAVPQPLGEEELARRLDLDTIRFADIAKRASIRLG